MRQPILATLVAGLTALFGDRAQIPWPVPSGGAAAFVQLPPPAAPAGQAHDASRRRG